LYELSILENAQGNEETVMKRIAEGLVGIAESEAGRQILPDAVKLKNKNVSFLDVVKYEFNRDIKKRLKALNREGGCFDSPYEVCDLADKVLEGRELETPTKAMKKLWNSESQDSKPYNKFGLAVAISRLEAEYGELNQRRSTKLYNAELENDRTIALRKKSIEKKNGFHDAIAKFLSKFDGVEIETIADLERLFKASAPKMISRGGAAGNVYGDVHVDVDLSITQVSQVFNHYGITIEKYMEDHPLELVDGKPNLVKFAVYCIDRVLSYSEQKAREAIASCEPQYGKPPFSVDGFMDSLYVRDDDGKRIGLDPVNYPDVYVTLIETMFDNVKLKRESLSLKKQLEEGGDQRA
jgi:hypothetical protein